MGDYCRNTSENSHVHPGWLGCGTLTFCLENKHFDTLAFFHYTMGVMPAVLPSILGTSLRWGRRFYGQCIWAYMCVPNYGETLLFVQKRSNDWTIFLEIPRLFTCSISSCDSDVLINIFDNIFDNCDELTRVLELLFSYIIDQDVFYSWFVVKDIN